MPERETRPPEPPETSAAPSETMPDVTETQPIAETTPAGPDPTEPPTEPSTHAPVETETDSAGKLTGLFRYDDEDRLIEETHYLENGKIDGALKTESCRDYTDDGQPGNYEETQYYEDGTSVRARLSVTDRRYRIEYDEQGREILREAKSLDGSVTEQRITREYAEDGSDRCTVTNEHILGDGRHVSEVTTYVDGVCREWITSTEGDDYTNYYVYDELGRRVRDESLSLDGFLLRTNQYEFFGDSSQYSRYYYSAWDAEANAYSETEYLYDENGTARQLSWKESDGRLETRKNNEKGEALLTELYYASGQIAGRRSYEYYADSDYFSRQSWTEWDEDGSVLQESVTTYYENGRTKRYQAKSSDGTSDISEYNEDGNQTLRACWKNGVLQYRTSWTYYPSAAVAVCDVVYEDFDEDGKLDQQVTEHFLEDGSFFSRDCVYGDGSAEYSEFKDGSQSLIRRFYPDGTLETYWYIGEDGISRQTDYYESGAVHYYREETGDLQLLYEAYTEAGILRRRETNQPDGFYEHVDFYPSSGLMARQDIKDASGTFCREFNEDGKIRTEVRHAPDEAGTYLGYTYWQYFEEGGVKKVRISVFDSNNTLISETVENVAD